jgi:hypothetical protein
MCREIHLMSLSSASHEHNKIVHLVLDRITLCTLDNLSTTGKTESVVISGDGHWKDQAKQQVTESQVSSIAITGRNWHSIEILSHHSELCKIFGRPHDVVCAGRMHLKRAK